MISETKLYDGRNFIKYQLESVTTRSSWTFHRGDRTCISRPIWQNSDKSSGLFFSDVFLKHYSANCETYKCLCSLGNESVNMKTKRGCKVHAGRKGRKDTVFGCKLCNVHLC